MISAAQAVRMEDSHGPAMRTIVGRFKKLVSQPRVSSSLQGRAFTGRHRAKSSSRNLCSSLVCASPTKLVADAANRTNIRSRCERLLLSPYGRHAGIVLRRVCVGGAHGGWVGGWVDATDKRGRGGGEEIAPARNLACCCFACCILCCPLQAFCTFPPGLPIDFVEDAALQCVCDISSDLSLVVFLCANGTD